MKHIRTHLEKHPTAERIPHSWAFQNAKEFTNEFAWPQVDFDLNDALAQSHANDKTLEVMTARLSRFK